MPAALPDSVLGACFLVDPAGQISASSEALLQLLGYPPAASLPLLPDLLSDAQQAQQLLAWLRQGTGLAALCLPSVLRQRNGQAVAVTLFANRLQLDGVTRAFCGVHSQVPAAPPHHDASDSAMRLKFVTEATGKGVWDWRVDTGAVDYSPLWKRLIGYAEHEIAGHYEEWRSRVHPQDLERVLATLKECLEGGAKGFKFEYRLRCKDGTYAWVLSRGAVAERDGQGRPLRVIGTLRNIIKRVQARLQLEQSEERLRAITENTAAVIVMKDLQGRYLHVNRRFEEVYRMPRASVLGKTALELFPREMALCYHQHDQAAVSSGTTVEAYEPALHADGALRTYISVRVPIRDERGRIYAICAIQTDITDHQQMQNQIRIAAVAFESPISMMVTDAQQVIQKVNQAFVSSTGFSAEFAVGQTPRFLRSGKHDAAFYRTMWQSIHACGTWQGEIWGLRRDQTLYPKWLVISSVKDAAGRVSHYVATEVDISERKRAEMALHKLNQALEKKKAQLRELVANNEAAREHERKHIAREVHDELGQTLTALRMDTSYIAMRFGEQDPALHTKVLDMRTLVDKAIQGVRVVASNLRPVALDMGLFLALDWLCKDFSKHSGVVCLITAQDQHIELDEARAVGVFRIVQESLTNIGRYAGASQVRVGFGISGQQLGVEIQDDGQGFDPRRAQRHKSFGLLGMKERALVLGGRLDIISAPGQGTTIGLSIPYRDGGLETVPERAA